MWLTYHTADPKKEKKMKTRVQIRFDTSLSCNQMLIPYKKKWNREETIVMKTNEFLINWDDFRDRRVGNFNFGIYWFKNDFSSLWNHSKFLHAFFSPSSIDLREKNYSPHSWWFKVEKNYQKICSALSHVNSDNLLIIFYVPLAITLVLTHATLEIYYEMPF